MRIKRIRIKSREAFDSDLMRVAKALDQGEKPEPMRGEFFESLDAVRNVLTEKRLELWRIIRDRKPDSITTLTKMAKRNFKAVYRDLLLLQSVGLITFKKAKGKRGDVQSPVCLVDELHLAVD